MRVLVVFAHPVENSFSAALHRMVLETLRASGHEVDDIDLYADGFDPRLSREEWLTYHDVEVNRKPVNDYVERLLAAEALVLVFPVWNFGYPAILKGFFDRVFMPGVSFRMSEGNHGDLAPCLHNIRKVAAVTHYGGNRLRAFLAGDPPRKAVTRVLRSVVKPFASFDYLALYDMNHMGEDQGRWFIEKVRARLTVF